MQDILVPLRNVIKEGEKRQNYMELTWRHLRANQDLKTDSVNMFDVAYVREVAA